MDLKRTKCAEMHVMKEVAQEILAEKMLDGYEDVAFESITEGGLVREKLKEVRLISGKQNEIFEKNECNVTDNFSEASESTCDDSVSMSPSLVSSTSESTFRTISELDTTIATNLDIGNGDLSEEILLMAKIMIGKWETMLPLSDPLDPLFKRFGISYLKRVVVDKLSIPLTISLQDDKTNLHVAVHLPVGNRQMNWRLDGTPSCDNDPDCGIWKGTVKSVNYSIPSINEGKPFKALQQHRAHEKIGLVHETRAVLPDEKFGRILHLKYKLFPKNDPDQVVEVLRILRPLP